MPNSNCTRTSRKCASIYSPAKASTYGRNMLRPSIDIDCGRDPNPFTHTPHPATHTPQPTAHTPAVARRLNA